MLSRLALSDVLIVALVATTLGLLWLTPTGNPGVEVDSPVHHLGQVVARSEHPITFRLRNSGSGPLRILGASSPCGRFGCIQLEFDEPRTVLPGESSDIDVTYRAGKSGPFSRSFTVYTDVPGQSEIELAVKGTVGPPALAKKPG